MAAWFITGCSSGFGRELALMLLERGDRVAVSARNLADVSDLVDAHPDNALGVALDVTDVAAIQPAVDRALSAFGAIDVLVNNAGYGYRAAIEEGHVADVERLFATNLFGPIALIKAVLPSMRERHQGTIVNVSSVASQVPLAGSGYYAATKSALEAVTGALQLEVGPLGIHAFSVVPGPFRTDFAGRSLTQSPEAISDYADTAGIRRKENDRTHGTQAGDPRRAAAAIVSVVDDSADLARLVLGERAVTSTRAALQERLNELERWQDLGLSTDFE